MTEIYPAAALIVRATFCLSIGARSLRASWLECVAAKYPTASALGCPHLVRVAL